MKRSQLIAGATALAVFATAFGAATTADAQPGKGGHRHGAEMTFEQLDTDGDGKITAEDFAAAKAARFAEMDADGNGTISAEELTAKMQERQADRAAKMIERLDENGDGVLSAEELEAGHHGHKGHEGHKGKRGGKDRADRPEGPEGAERPDRAAKMIERFDTDGDGGISAEEFEAAKAKMAERHEGMRKDGQPGE